MTLEEKVIIRKFLCGSFHAALICAMTRKGKDKEQERGQMLTCLRKYMAETQATGNFGEALQYLRSAFSLDRHVLNMIVIQDVTITTLVTRSIAMRD